LNLQTYQKTKYLNTSSANVENILNILEKTGLLFHLEAYGTSSKRTRKSWKYYFATSSLKYALSSKIGNVSTNKEKYEGILIENIIASKLHHLSMDNFRFSLYYDENKKNNVDFIIHRSFEKPIPIEVGRGKKDRRQITHAMNNYDAEYGIVISNRTFKIEKEEDIIYIPTQTFALL